jgi:hypothetical protein
VKHIQDKWKKLSALFCGAQIFKVFAIHKYFNVFFFAYRNESGTFYRQNRSESNFFRRKIVVKVVFFCIILFHLLGDDCQSIPTYLFFVMQKKLCTTRYESIFFHFFA